MFPLIILAGPTASGKSETAIALAEHLGTEIINADSLQVYKYFDIGTAKPSLEARLKVVHHLIDIVEPHMDFTAFDFKARALECARDLADRGKIPILVGGTGLYLKVLTQDYHCAVQVSPEIRERVKAEIRLRGSESLHAELAGIDAPSADRISPADPLRIERALAVYYQTGQKFSDFRETVVPTEREFDAHYYVFEKDRKQLYADIDRRVDNMMQTGLLDEARRLLDSAKDLKPFQSIGYAQMKKHLAGEITLDRAVYEIKRETRHYAKRQITWFKKVPGAHFISVGRGDTPLALRDKILGLLPAGIGLMLCAWLLFAPGISVSAGTYDDGLRFFGKKDYAKALNHFQVIRRSLTGSNESKQAMYLIGQTYLAMQDHKNAVEAFKTSLAEYPEIEDYVLLDLAKSYYGAEEYPQALDEVVRLLEKFSQSRLIPQAELFRAEVLGRLGKNEDAIVFLRKAEEKYSQKPRDPDFAPYLPQLIFKAASLMEAERRFKEAYTLYRELYVNYPNHPLTGKSAPNLARLGEDLHSQPFSEEEVSTRIQGLLAEVHYQQTIDEIARFMGQGTARLSPRFYFYQATAFQGLRKRAQANEALLSYLKEYPQHARSTEATYLIARNYWNLSQDENGIRYFQKVAGGDSEWSVKSQYFLGRLYEDGKQYDLARKNYELLANMPTSHEYKESAAWRLAWTYYKAGDYRQAFEKFKNNIERMPEGKIVDNNMFWMAKSAGKLGRDELARQTFTDLCRIYPFSYYGLRAREKLLAQNKDSLANIETVPPKEEQAIPAPAIHLSPEEQFHYLRAREMIDMGQSENARLELRQIEKTAQKNLSTILWLSTLYNRAGIYSESFRLLNMYKDLMGDRREKDFPVRFWKSLYPPAYAESIRFSSRNHQVDPFLVRGVIHQESMFDARAMSRAGARGLMQLMPETGRRLARSLDEHKSFVPDSLFDPEVNIKLGVRYLSELLKNTGNNPAHVLISYNAGPDVLKKWLQQFRNLEDEDEFLESIPYQETRIYVRRVLRNYGIYKLLYSNDAGNMARDDLF